FACIWLLLAGDDAEQRGLASPVRTDHADDAAGGQVEADVVEQQAFAEPLFQSAGFDHQIAEAWSGRNVDLVGFVALLEFLRRQLLVALQARLALGLARFRVGAHPLELALERTTQTLLLLLLHGETPLLLLQPGGV